MNSPYLMQQNQPSLGDIDAFFLNAAGVDPRFLLLWRW